MERRPSDVVLCYTDGSRIKGDFGGWAYIILRDDQSNEVRSSPTIIRCYSGPATQTTSSLMELTAMFNALHNPILVGKVVTVRTDSKYVCNGINLWMDGWMRDGWTKPKYPELWKKIHAVCTKLRSVGTLKVEWVKGHSKDPYNTLVDKLATNQSAIAKLSASVA